MKMKKIYKNILCGGLLLFALGLTSCESYLDKSADSTVSDTEAYKNFTNFQGFVEEMYNCIPDKLKNYWNTSWNWGDDEVMDSESSWRTLNQFDQGNFWAWQAEHQSQPENWLDKSSTNPSSTDKFSHALWPHAWYCIRKCNLGLANLDKMTDATDEEKNLIAGQLYFFRAWWHFELMEWFGGLPYITKVLPGDQKLTLPRLTYQQCADSAAIDFQKAVDLLPINWDNTTIGKATMGKNALRINKIMALGYLGKNYLWAGSPLMKNGAQTGGANTYTYDQTYCKKAADAFGQLLSLVESGQTQYALAEFNYKDIYNHKKSDDATTCFSDIFSKSGQSGMPGTCEAIFCGPSTDAWGSSWGSNKTFGPTVAGVVDPGATHMPTANYINYAYGMANGLPITDPDSGFDPTHPFKNRDPRFYHDIVFDGFKYVNGTMTDKTEYLRYCGLNSDGTMRDAKTGSRTGYFYQKLCPHICNHFDGGYDWPGTHLYLPYMRLADIYLMYAEACAATDGATGKSTNFSKTAEDAINTLRDRVGEAHVNAKFEGNKQKFMDEVRRERAVELSFEGFRFNDLQRWLLLTEAPYTVKTSQEFNRVSGSEKDANGVYTNNWYKNNDPRNAEVSGLTENTILTRKFSAKHYWLPLKVNDTSMYPEFGQNYGW